MKKDVYQRHLEQENKRMREQSLCCHLIIIKIQHGIRWYTKCNQCNLIIESDDTAEVKPYVEIFIDN